MSAYTHKHSSSSVGGGSTSTSDSSLKGYSNKLRRSRILLFSLLYNVQCKISNSYPVFRILIYFLEMLQLVSICLEYAFTSFGNHSVDSGLYYFERIRMVMPPVADSSVQTAVLSIAIIYLGLVMVVGTRLAFVLGEGDGSHPKWIRLWGVVTILVQQIIYLPILSMLFSVLHCGIVQVRGDGTGDFSLSGLHDSYAERFPNYLDKDTCPPSQSITFIVLASVSIAITVFLFCIFSISTPGYDQHRNSRYQLFAMTFNRIPLFLFLIKTAAIFFVEFSGPIVFSTRTGLYQWGLILCFLGLTVHVLYYLPFYRRTANCIYASFFAVCFWAALCAFVSNHVDTKIHVFIAFMVLIVPIIVLVSFGCYMRCRVYYTTTAWESGQSRQTFKRPFEVEIYTRPFAITPRDKDQTKLYQETVISIFWRGMQQFSTDLGVRVALLQYLLEDKGNFQLLTSVAEKVKSPNTAMDMKFLLYSIEKHRITMALAMDGGAEEISKNILRANNHANKAKVLIKSFWESLLHEEELMLLPMIVAKLEREETKADLIFKKLRSRFPNNPAVLRHYAQFLDEVKNDPEGGLSLYKQADELEQEIATRHAFHTHSRPHIMAHQTSEDEQDIMAEAEGKQKNKAPEQIELETISKAKRRKKRDREKFHSLRTDPDAISPRKEDPYSDGAHMRQDGSSAAKEHGSSHSIMAKRMTKFELMRYRRYRTQAESSRSHSVWKMTYAINLTLLILLVNMVIVFGATMGILSNQENAVDQLIDVVTTRNAVSTSISSTLRATRVISTEDNVTFAEDVQRMNTSVMSIEQSTVEIFNIDGPVKRGWTETLYPVWTWTSARQALIGGGYTESNLNALDALAEYTFWMNQAITVILNPTRGADGLWNSTGGRFIIDNGLTSVFDALNVMVNLYQEKSEATIRLLRDITAALLPFSFLLLLVLIWFLLRAAIREIQQERISILKLFLGIPKDNILAIVGHIRGKELGDIDEDELFAADEDEVSTFTATVDLDGDAEGPANQQNSTLWVLRNTRLSMLRSFFLRFLVSLMLVFVLVLVASSIVLASVESFSTSVNEVNLAGKRRSYLAHLQSSTLALAYYDEIAREQPGFDPTTLLVNTTMLRSFIVSDLAELESVNFNLTYGVDGHGGISKHSYLIDSTYNNMSCGPLPGYTYTCTGTNSLLVYVFALAEIVLSYPDSTLGFNTTQVATLSDVAFSQLNPIYLDVLNYYRSQATNVINQVRTAVIVIFVLIFPVLLAVNFMLRPMSVQIKQEHQRTLRMLLMIPLNVIDNTPAIKDYLDNMLRDAGRTPWYKNRSKKNQKSDEKFLSTHEPLLQAVVREAEESLLVISTEGTVEMCNPASERLFGFEKRQIVGHHVSTIFTEQSTDELSTRIMQHRPRILPTASITSNNSTLAAESFSKMQESIPLSSASSSSTVREQLELVGRKSDGEVFPVSVTLSQFKVNGKTYFGTYIRDITYTKNMEMQVEKERLMLNTQQKRLHELLMNVFPKSIAEQLMAKGDDYQPQLIAEEYKEATILFGDIVGFTNMCSDLEPAVLLLILDGIFTEWDALVEKYNLQKIKTIGDCFMVAGGVPDRMVDHVERMIDFAFEMIETLQKYNDNCALLKSRSLSLNLRIGINTGPVVAGIIGRSRICFDLWGDAVNVASRMESTSIVGRIQVSQPVFNRVKNKYEFEERGSIDVKGKGAMLTYLLVAPRFKRTGSGKVIDLRFAPHMQQAKSSISNADSSPSHIVTSASTSHPLSSTSHPLVSSHQPPHLHHSHSSNSHSLPFPLGSTINLTNSGNMNLSTTIPSPLSPSSSSDQPPTPVSGNNTPSSPGILKNPFKDPNNKDPKSEKERERERENRDSLSVNFAHLKSSTGKSNDYDSNNNNNNN